MPLVLNLLKVVSLLLNVVETILSARKEQVLEEKREEIRSDSSSEWAASFGVRRKGSEACPSSKTDS
jgi:hypothetical protein